LLILLRRNLAGSQEVTSSILVSSTNKIDSLASSPHSRPSVFLRHLPISKQESTLYVAATWLPIARNLWGSQNEFNFYGWRVIRSDCLCTIVYYVLLQWGLIRPEEGFGLVLEEGKDIYHGEKGCLDSVAGAEIVSPFGINDFRLIDCFHQIFDQDVP